MIDSPRIHLGSVLRFSEDAHASGSVSQLEYQQGEEHQTLHFAAPAAYEVDVNALSGDEMYLQGHFEPTLNMECSRCLRPVQVPLQVPLQIILRYDPSVEEPYLEEAESGEELLIFGDPDLDLSAYLAESTLLLAPLTVLHAPDCRGLCQVCGHDLNEGPCEHQAVVPLDHQLDQSPTADQHAKQHPFSALKDFQFPED